MKIRDLTLIFMCYTDNIGGGDMLYNFCYFFILFIIYSFIGYLSEAIYCSIDSKKIVLNRGFFMGPYLPIYGVSAVLMNFFLEKYQNDLVALFVMSVVVCSITEFFTSLILEKIFKVRWWDYSEMKFNIDGRICLLNSFLFGIGGVALVYVINPVIFPIINMLSSTALIIIGLILVAIFVTDLVISIITLCKIKISSNKYTDHDATEEIKLLVNESIKNSFFIRRLLNAFPRISGRDKNKVVNLKKRLNEIRMSVKENKEKLKEYNKQLKEKNKKKGH